MALTTEDVAVRNATYRVFVELGRGPSADEVASSADASRSDVRSAWQRLHQAHALVLDDTGEQIRMANPFSAVPTDHRVRTGERWWFANCAWDAFGICAALDSPGRIESTCPDCGDPIAVEVRARQPDDTSLLFHCLVPALQWWDDIGFT